MKDNDKNVDGVNQDKMEKSQIDLMKEEKSKLQKQKNNESKLTKSEVDIIGEIANISFGAASTALSEMLNKAVTIDTPEVEVVNKDEIDNIPLPYVVLNVNYVKGLNVENLLIIEQKVANAIADLMMGGTGEVQEKKEMDEMSLSAVQEAMNQMMGSAATAMSESFGKPVDISPPSIKKVDNEEDIKEIKEEQTSKRVVKISFQLMIDGLLESNLYQLVTEENAKIMAREILEAMMPGSPKEEILNNDNFGKKEVQEENNNQEEVPIINEDGDVPEYLKEVDVKIEVIYGNTRKRLKDLLAMKKGQVVNLKEEIDEPVHVYANGILIAKGEIVQIDGYFGVKITELVS